MTYPLPVILDTDIGNDPDDVLALAMILDRPDLFDIKGVIATGMESELRAHFVAVMCLVAGRPDIPIGVGCETAHTSPPTAMHRDFFERNTPLGGNLPELQSPESVMDLVAPDICFVTIGPLTTLARFIVSDSSLPGRLGNVVSMGGFVSRRNTKPVGEFNFGVDPEATRRVLAFDVRHLCVTKNVCHHVRMVEADTDRVDPARSPARAWAFGFMKEWFRTKPIKILYDPLTLAIAIRPDCADIRPVEFTLIPDNRIAKMSGRILDQGNRTATIGGAIRDLTWFDEIYYGLCV
jgi:inosine-uridine nucleoside N-ribohydrolase